jgi:Na+-driven multidrug efflux pump
VVSAVLVAWLGSTSGAEGAAWATLAGEAVLCAGYLLGLARGRPELVPSIRTLPRVAVAAAGGAAVALAGLPALPTTVAAVAVFAALALALRAVPAELIEWVRGRVANRG